VEAVIDKDMASQRLAADLEASVLLILTDVHQVALRFGTPQEEFLDHMSVDEAERYLQEGHFPPGSMGPKVRAASKFVRSGGTRAVISSLQEAGSALAGRAGTTISR
jgi:carbamate kinase